MQRRGVEAYAAERVDRLVVGTTSTDLNEQFRQLETFAAFMACDADRRVPERRETLHGQRFSGADAPLRLRSEHRPGELRVGRAIAAPARDRFEGAEECALNGRWR
jgi:hypothetical protein